MIDNDNYLQKADECDRLANDASNDELRDKYKEMAKTWRTLAVNPAPPVPASVDSE